jgi:class 3 adenylate cyclase
LKINGAVINIINPALAAQYPKRAYTVRHHIGVDTSSLFVARIGVRNDNDLVWVGRAANYAAKLCAISEYNTVFITEDVFSRMHNDAKIGGTPKRLMWKERR